MASTVGAILVFPGGAALEVANTSISPPYVTGLGSVFLICGCASMFTVYLTGTFFLQVRNLVFRSDDPLHRVLWVRLFHMSLFEMFPDTCKCVCWYATQLYDRWHVTNEAQERCVCCSCRYLLSGCILIHLSSASIANVLSAKSVQRSLSCEAMPIVLMHCPVSLAIIMLGICSKLDESGLSLRACTCLAQ